MSDVLPGQVMMFGPTLHSAKMEVLASLDAGIRCPCCDKFVKRYRRKFNSSMARSLIWLHKQTVTCGSGWVDVPLVAPRWLVRTNQLPSVRWWGLIERHPSTDEAKKHSGLWRPTEKGIYFALKKIRVQSTAVTYNGSIVGFEGDEISIEDALGTKFDYAQIMGNI